MKVTLSLPNALRQEADDAAKDLRVSRSKLIQMALEQLLKERRERAFAESINRYMAEYDPELSEEDKIWIAHGQAVVHEQLKDDDWSAEWERHQRRRAAKARRSRAKAGPRGRIK